MTTYSTICIRCLVELLDSSIVVITDWAKSMDYLSHYEEVRLHIISLFEVTIASPIPRTLFRRFKVSKKASPRVQTTTSDKETSPKNPGGTKLQKAQTPRGVGLSTVSSWIIRTQLLLCIPASSYLYFRDHSLVLSNIVLIVWFVGVVKMMQIQFMWVLFLAVKVVIAQPTEFPKGECSQICALVNEMM